MKLANALSQRSELQTRIRQLEDRLDNNAQVQAGEQPAEDPVELLKEREMRDVIAAAYRKSKEQVGLPKEQMVNYVKEIYAPFTDEEISAKMVELLTPKGTKAKVQIVYQPLEGLHEACPKHPGDWYFSGDYPTPGGVKLLNKAFIDYIEQVYQF